MQILCVEDGSVDLDALENDGLKDGMILPYRQGSTPPFVLELDIDYIPPQNQDLERLKRETEHYRTQWNNLKVVVIDTIMKYKDNILYKGKAFEQILDFIKTQENNKDYIEEINKY